MELEIQEIIKKNLPAHVGDVLKKRLEQADADASELKNYKEAVVSRDKTITEQQKKIEEYKQFDDRNIKLEAREKTVAEQERNLRISTLEYELKSEKEKTALITSVAMGLVRNTEYKRSIWDSERQNPYQGGHGNMVYPTSVDKHFDETKKAE